MECINSNCKKRDRVKARFAEVDEDEEELSCPYCKQPLRRTSAIKKPKEEATSAASDESTEINEGKSSEASPVAKAQDDQSRESSVKDDHEQSTVRAIVSQHFIEDKVQNVQDFFATADHTTKKEQVSDITKEQQLSESVGIASTSDESFQERLQTSSCQDSDFSKESKTDDNLIPVKPNDPKKDICTTLNIPLDKPNQITKPSGKDSHETPEYKNHLSIEKGKEFDLEFSAENNGQAYCVEKTNNNSLPASRFGRPHVKDPNIDECSKLKINSSPTKDQTFVRCDGTYSRAVAGDSKEESIDPDNITDHDDKGVVVKNSEDDTKSRQDETESDFDSNDDQGETDPLDQSIGQPTPYGKDVVKLKKKEAKTDKDSQAKEMDESQERQKQDNITRNQKANEGSSSSPLEQKEPGHDHQQQEIQSHMNTTAASPPSFNPVNEKRVTNTMGASHVERIQSHGESYNITTTTPFVAPVFDESAANKEIRDSLLDQKSDFDQQQQAAHSEANTTNTSAAPGVTPVNGYRVTKIESSSRPPLEQSGFDQQQTAQHVEAISTTTAIPCFATPMYEDSVTIVFHALLSPDFRFKEKKHKVTLRAGLPELGNWSWDCVDINPVSETEEKFVHVRGEMLLPVKLLYRRIPYKYVIWNIKERKAEWEFSEFADCYPRVVNRSLALFREYKIKGAIWHQFDGVIYPEPQSTWPWGKNGFNQAEVLKNRQHAAKTFFPKWKGFITNPAECEPMLATIAVEQMSVMSYCLTNVCLDVNYHTNRIVSGLEFEKILAEFLKPKLEYNASLSEKDLESSEVTRIDRLVSSLAITHVIALYDVDLAYDELKGILHCLVIRANVSGGCDFDGIRNDFPEEMWSHLVQSILHVMKAASKKHPSRSCPDFILAVPLIHFLRKELKPFEEPEETHLTTIKEWCRAKGLIQYKTYDDGFVDSFLPEASPMFKVDPLLCRLFLHYTPLEDFPKVSNNLDFPMHEICTALFYRVRNAFSTSKLWAIEETLSNLIKRQITRQERSEQSKTLLFAKTSISLLQELVAKQVKPNDKLFFTGIHFALEALCSAGYDCPENERKTKIEDERQGHVTDDDNLSIILNVVDAAIEKKFYSKFSVSKDSQKSKLKLKVWTALLNLNVSKKSIGDSWIKNLVLLFERRLEEVDDKNVLELFCEVEMDENFHQALVQCITKHAFDTVERIVEKGGSEGAFTALHDQSLRSGAKSKAGELLSRLIARAWSKAMAKKNEITHHDVLRFALMWKPWAGFLSFYGSQEKEKMLTQHANRHLHRVIDCLLEVQDALADGSIEVKPLTLLNQFKENFMCLCLVLSTIQTKSEDNQGWHSIEDVNMNLEKRMEEYRVFQTTKEHLQKFVGICRSTEDVAFDISGLQEKANCDTSDVRMADLCKRVPSDDAHATERIDVVFFDNLPSIKLPFILTQILDAYKTKTFQVIWKSTCKAVLKDKKADNEMLKGKLTLLDVLDKVWPPSIKKWTLLAQSVFDGSIKLKDVDRSFKTIGSEEDLKEELDIMFQQTVNEDSSLMGEIVSERVSQVARYRSLQDYIQAAETIWKFKEALRLSGDFDVIEDLRNQESEEFRDKDLKSIDERFIRAGKYLTVIPLEHSCCLDTVIECEPLVTWLRETIKDTSALSTLVDLAMISAGENDLEVDRISNFHSSCLNFAPLIFNLNASFGFEDLMKTCEPVWKAVIQDKKLSKKLAETCRHLKWLKAVQSSHGSVEMSSIMQVKTINSSGVFQVGQISQDPNEGLSVSGEHKELENVFTLTVPIDPKTRGPRGQQEEKKREGLKTYSLNDLKDLQSKLMLIAGKTAQLQNKDGIESTEEIKGFVEVLEGVMRLGQVYIDLCEAGDVKYLDWSKEIDCSVNRLSTHQSVAEELAVTSKKMEKRLRELRSHVHEKRHRYKQLNHYTTKQILVLRKELGLLREGASVGGMPLQVYTLLESVLPDIKSEDLNQVLSETLGFEMDVRRTTMSDSLMPPPSPQQGRFRSATLREKYQPFLLSVEKMKFNDEVAIAALKANDVTKNQDVNENELITWCFDNGEDEEMLSDWFDKAREDEDFVDFFPELWQGTVLEGSFLGNEADQAEDLAEDNLDGFEQHPYLTLDELGSVLARLSSKCGKPDRRKFPDYLSRNKPNLLLVPKESILPTVLTLFMQYGGNSLPTACEVLVCTYKTTAEEIELFWWRALADTNQQMYCLIHPDVLDYNVSQSAVKMLDTLMDKFKTSAEGCRIIVLCSTENEDRSHIIAAFDEYRKNAVPGCASADVLSRYLAEQFSRSTSLTGYFNEERVSWIPAASLDDDNLSVRLVCSDRAGAGKSLKITRFSERILNLTNNMKVTKVIEELLLTVTVPLHGTVAHTGPLLDGLWKHPVRGDLPVSRIVHLDVSPSVTKGLETLLFNLLVLGVICDNSGRLWRRKPSDLYLIEMTNPVPKALHSSDERSRAYFVSIFPTINCATPVTTLQNLKVKRPKKFPSFDDQEYHSIPVQRAFQYLRASDAERLKRFRFQPRKTAGTPAECLALLIKHCGIEDPSWSELKHFVDFLNSQLQDCEESIYCQSENVDDLWMRGTLAGFKSFVIQFMVTMSRDFSTPSLDNEPAVCSAKLVEGEDDDDDDDEYITPLQLRRRWESSPHPYIFFNQDRITMTFLGFHITKDGDLTDPDTQDVIQSRVMTKELRSGLAKNEVDFNINYSAWSKYQRIGNLCAVIGVQDTEFDPDTSYELTIDNMKKILAIHMRFRCGIPVIIMGETGCGKTRLIRYMCALQAGQKGQRNMLLMKVHGGTSFEDITKKVEQAEKMAAENEKIGIDTVLFFDEANTTNALGMINEVMVDRRINGRPVGVGLRRLHFIAACNPYRRHTDEMIKKLESAGLGYSVKSEETKDKLGKIPLRHLVYRVHALPPSMRPLVWDFGQLKPDIEELYIHQIVKRYVPGEENVVTAISKVLAAAQKYMREQKDECSFVSLRDVERTMNVMTWFHQHHKHLRPQITHSQDEDSDEEASNDEEEPMDIITWSLLMSVGVCYHAKLQDQPRTAFRRAVASACDSPLNVNGGEEQMLKEIASCQKVMIDELNLGPNIARNTALSENVFMMVVCIELRIPLFVIGKPGSSKSLAKTVVADNMQGDASKSQLFKSFKRAHMVSYQCSPLSTPEGIVGTFRQCRRLQENNQDDRYASVVVLDEVGLAEDSPLLPLKALHPLLEDGVTSSDDIIETDEKPTRVAFIGISNWALDPAKMNRGLMLMRGEPNQKELEDSAWGICAEREDVRQHLSTLLNQLAAGYADLYAKQKSFKTLRTSKRDEFFGLRDFYSLVKMVYSIAADKNGKPTWSELEHAIRRNFGGLDEIDAVGIFRKHVTDGKLEESEPLNTLDLLRASLDHKNAVRESRYLLVLTENYSALPIVEQELIKNKDNYVVIFGSSFPKDQEYTQVCRNINQIKVCMETGRTVVLLNLESLYESLYDALNQYYVYCADQKYVDLGLGSHRVKCRVDDNFRLIVIAEKEVVYKKFPIPLINRLEKHYLVTSKSLKRAQQDLAKDLEYWARDFAKLGEHQHQTQQDFKIGDAFVGYQSDTIPAMIFQACAESTSYSDEGSLSISEEWFPEVKDRCQKLLLQCATPDAIARLPSTRLRVHANELMDTYFKQQEHISLPACLRKLLDQEDRHQSGLLVQVSTHSRLLSENNLVDVCQATNFKRRDAELLTLQQFQTEQQFLKQVREFFIRLTRDEGILLVQCDSGDENFNLVACTRHLLVDQRMKRAEMLMESLEIKNVPPVHIVIIIQLPRVQGGCVNFVGFQGGQWDSFHVDDLRPPTNQIPPIQMLIGQPISELLKPADAISREAPVEDTNQAEMMEQDKMNTSVERFDSMVLLRRSVQAAAGRLDDDPVMAKRKTERIDLILSLLPEDSSEMPVEPSFAKSLQWKIFNLLEEKNEKQTGIDLARLWVRNEAISGTSVHERGTFRRALQHRVVTEVEPLLAKVFAYADRDCNLGLLRDQEPWIIRLWICIFDNKRLSEIYYELSSSKIREHVEVSGKGGHVFGCSFPFSWLIKEIIDQLYRREIRLISSRSIEREEVKLRRILENSELGSILSIIQEEGEGDEAGKRYLHDFVHMVYKPIKEDDDEEVQIVSRAVIAAAEKMSNGEFHLDFAAIHVAFNLIQFRLSNFNLLVQAEPDLTRFLLENPPQLTIDVAGLIICLEKLRPNHQDLKSSEKRNEWCRRVLNVRKTIEAMTSKEVFSKKRGEIDDYEEEEKNCLQRCWEMWQRISVVRLFIDHVCNLSQQPNAKVAQNVLKLWKILGDNTNFLTKSCICRLEEFLLECSQEQLERNKCFEVNCIICLKPAKKPSVNPCGHYCCLECATRSVSENQTCPKCAQPFPADYAPTESKYIREALNNLATFRNQCNSFFMEVVSLFCFGYSPCGTLEKDAYELLMDHVTGKESGGTKQFSPFPDQEIDDNPVVRSFLLQQLLKSSNLKPVKEYMDSFIKRAQDVVEMDATSSVEVFVMCVQCMEDDLDSKFRKRASELALDQKMRHLERYFKSATQLLSESREEETLDIKWLEGIANIRFVLSKAADFMYQSRSDTDSTTWANPDVGRALDKLIAQAKEICCKTLLTTPRLFLLKQLSRKYGFESVNVLAKDFNWILPPEARASNNVIQDRFLVYGPEYQILRETISMAVISGDMDSVQGAFENMNSPASVSNVALVLGMYRAVTTNKNITGTIKQNLKTFLRQSKDIPHQSRVLARDLVTAETEGNISDVLRIAADTPWDRSMVDIIIHLATVLFSHDQDDLVGPLQTLALHPGMSTDSFLPSMPDDPLQDVRSAVVGTLYECPNGHPYLVTECGRPMEKSRCREHGCGEEIGGSFHQLTDTNRSARTEDLTEKGHCLGSPDERGTEPTPERKVSPLVTSLLRLLVHGSMLIGSCYHKQDICKIISPAIPEDSLHGFLWKHVMCDMQLLSSVSGRSVDDAALMVHIVLHKVSQHVPIYQGQYDTLDTKQERVKWENNFTASLVVPLMTNLESNIQKKMKLIVNDNRLGANPLLCQLYELDCGVEVTCKVQPNCMALWRYRTPVTLDHVARAFNESAHAQDEAFAVLSEFLKQEHKLCAIQFLPDVVKLQQLLMDRYHRTLDKAETDKLTWKKFEKHLPKGVVNDYRALRKSFRSAWDLMVASLAGTGTRDVTVKKLLKYSVNEESVMSMFIPATSGLGTYSFTLLQFLVHTHNEFIKLYERNSVKTSDLQGVPITEVTSSQLVSFDADRDLLPLMQAHCHYSLEVGHGTLVQYDWSAIQRQLIDRLVRGRVLIVFKEDEYLKTAKISAESVLTTLSTKIPQVELTLAIQNQIIVQYRSLQDVCEALSSLNIAIPFLASGGGKPDMLISEYIHKVLKLPQDTGLRNTKAQEACQIKHAVSLWRLLSIERAKTLTKRKQDPFEHLSSNFKESPSEAEEIFVNDTMKKMKDDFVDFFVHVLFEVIVLRLNESFDIDENNSIKDYLEWYLQEKDVAIPTPEVKDDSKIKDILKDFPAKVSLKHIVRFWQIVFTMSDKNHEGRIQEA